jgi:hypothetical protein
MFLKAISLPERKAVFDGDSLIDRRIYLDAVAMHMEIDGNYGH